MKNKFLLFFLFSFLITSSLQAQLENTRGLYVNNFKNVIGNPTAEEELLNFALENGFNYLLLYNLHYIQTNLFDITDSKSSHPLANFIFKAKTQYGINEVGGVGEKLASFDKMEKYNETYQNQLNYQIDVFHLEFEFWNSKLVDTYYCSTYLMANGFPCTKAGAFDFYFNELSKLDDLTSNLGLKSETYVGNPTNSECQSIGSIVDRAVVHYYRRSDVYKNGNSIYNFKKYRLEQMAPEEGVLNILPVFSSRSYHMGPWLLEHPMEQAFDTWLYGQNGFMEDEGDWKNHINIEGFQWYRYTDLKNYMEESNFNFTENTAQARSEEREIVLAKQKTKTIISPNPAREVLNLTISENEEFQIFDTMGRLVLEKKSSGTEVLNVKNWQRGIYFLKVEDEVRKIVLQ